MMSRAGCRILAALTVVCAAAVIPSALHAQGTITGHVTTEGQLPLPGARVLALGTNAEATTGDDGKFTLRNVRTGNVEVQALKVGYKSLKKTIMVQGGTANDLNFALASAVIQLTEIVTTATGQQRKVELGNAVATLGDVGKRVQESSITNVSDLLVAKTPGVILLPSPVVGGAPNIRIRGISSVSLANTPIWYVDGVRYNTTTSATNPVGAANSAGSTPLSLLNNLDPEEIEDIEIVKGPSAATLYGTNAANGVIVVTTKKGRPGATRWNWTAESRTVSDRNDYQDQFANFGHRISSTGVIGTGTRCQLAVMQTPKFTFSQGATCVSDSLKSYDYLSDPDATFIHLGRGSLFGLNVSGGNEGLRYFVSGDIDNEFGPIQMAQRDIDYYQSIGTQVTNSMFHPRQQ
ncbi:MAG: TonB-dependent receptor plug domain-containing protein, partial [Gemmatimonadaceae bacterium]